MKRKMHWGVALVGLFALHAPQAAHSAVSASEMSSLPACAPEFREGPAISMESWLEGGGECRADEMMLEAALRGPSQLAGRSAEDEEKPASCEWEPAVAQPVC